MRFLKYILPLFLAVLLASCGGTTIPIDPVKKMQNEFTDKYAYTITLQDMDLVGKQYRHKYKVFEVTKDKKIKIQTTDWENVDDYFFAQHADDLNMEILSKNAQGKYNNLATPPGFTHLVGNSNYGTWELGNRDNPSTAVPYWKFNPEYEYLAEELAVKNLPIVKTEYDQYMNEYKYNRPYYGIAPHTDSTHYGTRSSHLYHYRPIFFLRRSTTRNFYKPVPSGASGTRGGGGFGK